MMIQIDFAKENIRARVPAGSSIDGRVQFSTGLLLEGAYAGEMLRVNGTTVVLEHGVAEGKAMIVGDLYVLGTMSMERVEVQGVVHIATGAKVTGYFIAKDFKLHAGANVSDASLNVLT